MEFAEFSAEDKKRQLFNKQKELLDQFLEKGAITKEQYDKSLGTMIEKMGIVPEEK